MIGGLGRLPSVHRCRALGPQGVGAGPPGAFWEAWRLALWDLGALGREDLLIASLGCAVRGAPGPACGEPARAGRALGAEPLGLLGGVAGTAGALSEPPRRPLWDLGAHGRGGLLHRWRARGFPRGCPWGPTPLLPLCHTSSSSTSPPRHPINAHCYRAVPFGCLSNPLYHGLLCRSPSAPASALRSSFSSPLSLLLLLLRPLGVSVAI